ncbi:Sua5/YciO/YrdC/YwlC family protein [Ectothiorhodospiraceae bacterium WFHF3C12]|nr:Sua5/YciO/YrdC/YwlC family protein [Ectothiorhodospiraceae bacterium WFHF3C12]
MATSAFRLRLAARAIAQGGVIAYPTEAVFGLGCDPLNEQAVTRLLALKQRDPAKGLILIAAERDQLEPYVDFDSPQVSARIGDTWPGPVTWILPARPQTPAWLTGAHDTLAVRVTAHPTAAALCRACGDAIVSTSANHSGQTPARTLSAVRLRFGDELDSVVPGHCGGQAGPTEIRDSRTGKVLRAG